MANYIATDTDLTSVANAIRTKGGTSASLSFPSGFVEAIGNISGGGETEALSVTENGTYTAPTGKAYSPVVVNVPKNPLRITDVQDEHGGTIRTITTDPYADPNGDVQFIDYDGTLVASKTKAEINAMTSDSDLPANPTHTGLTAQGWNWTVAQLKAQLTAMPDQKIYVGQMYVTTSGATEIDVIMQDGRLSPILTICVKGTVSVDWGDGTTPDSVTGTSLTSRKAVGPHNYASAGSYTIKISKTSGNGYAFYGGSNYFLIRKNTAANENRVYANTIQSVRLGNDISIRNYAFYYCTSLTSVTIPSSVTSIEGSAFSYCYSLTSVTIPSSVTSIGSNTFQYCQSLASITIPSGVTSIGSNAFSYCHSLASLTIPSSVTSIGNTTFQYCYSLASVTIPSSVTSIGSGAFSYCYILTSVTIPSGVTSIGTNVFNYCYSLTSVTIPSSVTSIGVSAFSYCYSLAHITIPSGVTSIGSSAFQNCYSLASITIPSTVTSIGGSAFYGCYALTSITIPSTVTSIGNGAFQNCYGVSEYHFQSTSVPTGGTTMFDYNSSDCVIYVPYSADHSILEAYKTATNWSTYASKMQEEPQ